MFFNVLLKPQLMTLKKIKKISKILEIDILK